METELRKTEHINICLQEDVSGRNITTGFERYRLIHNALPEIDFAELRMDTTFLDKTLQVPLLVSSMTGGTQMAAEINKNLAVIAERRGWAMGIGSARAAVEKSELTYSFNMRKHAPSIPIIANLGAVQLNYGYGEEQCRRAVELTGADALVLHLNSMQEVFQPEGNTNFKNLLQHIEKVCHSLAVPVGIKEVGWGISSQTAEKLTAAGISFIDVAGAGGTSWSQVEKFRIKDAMRKEAAEAFSDWGIPTADCIKDVRKRLPQSYIIASGGLMTGVDVAKAIALGANLAAFGRTLLAPAVHSAELLERTFAQIEWELKAAMFGVGAANMNELQSGHFIALS